ncbi:MAG: methylated-DNA--[protein]-cysteine S-methyltransferase [Deltaproteobacteria bacterium]|nr:methylated-DNA--[protein]-cysteine S-methyltransferase [Deltaproteobacteria bacterium]
MRKTLSRDYERIEKAILYLERNAGKQPSLSEVAENIGLSEYHFQRLFRRFAGVSPKRFLQYLSAEHARRLLQASRTVLDAAFEVGLSGPGRLHDLMVKVHAMTPGEVKSLGAGLTIRFAFHDSPFGTCLLAVSDRGVCRLTFVPPGGDRRKLSDLKKRWPKAHFREDDRGTLSIVEEIFSHPVKKSGRSLGLHVTGTNFQIKVWEALLRVPPGRVISYGDLARRAGFPGASRAVGTAVGKNPMAYLIPCHRVIRATGAFGNYGGGPARKKAMLGWESARFGESEVAPRGKQESPGSR